MGIFELLFSPSGVIGRGVWWLMQLVNAAIGIIFFLLLVAIVTPDSATAPHHADSTVKWIHMTHQQQTEQAAAYGKTMAANLPKLCLLALAYLLMYWSNFAIEIKRWHDLGMSGAWCLLRFFPFLVLLPGPHHPMAIIIIACSWFFVFLGRIIILGFWKGYDHTPVSSYRMSQAASQPASQGGGSSFVLPALGVLIIGVVIWAYISSSVPTKQIQNAIATTSPASVPAPSGSVAANSVAAPAQAAPANAYQGTADTQYAKDWVMFDGQKLTDISSVLPSRGSKVLIVYAEGGKTAPVSALPQGFLNIWNITPEKLQELDQ
jgi:uncharacterized membrane protein YhaH (DUF805 family)